MRDYSVRNLLTLCVITMAWAMCTAYQISVGELGYVWLAGPLFMFHQVLCAMISYSLDRPALERTFGRLYLRFKMSHDWIYITDPKGNRNNVIFSFGFIEKTGIDARCWNMICGAWAFSVGWLPKQRKSRK